MTRAAHRRQGGGIGRRGGGIRGTPGGGLPPYIGNPAYLAAFEFDTLTPGAIGSWVAAKGGITLSQAVAGSKPTASATSFNGKPGLSFDGGDILTGAAGSVFSAYSGVRIVCGCLTSVSATQVLFELTAGFAVNNGSFATFFGPDAVKNRLGAGARGSTNFGYAESASISVIPPMYATFGCDTSVASGCSMLRQNGASVTPSAIAGSACGPGNFASGVNLNVGAREGGAVAPFTGILGGALLFLSGNAVDADLLTAEAYVKAKAGL